MKELWIMRHGDAEWTAPSDDLRALSSVGCLEVASVAKKLNLEGSSVFWHSPYLRAVQTFKLFIENSNVNSQLIEEQSLLTPEADPALLFELIEAYEHERLFLVSHMPIVSRILKALTQDERLLPFVTAQIVHLKKKPNDIKWNLEAIYSPDQIK